MTYHNTTLRTKNKDLTLDELHLSKRIRNRINQLAEEFSYIDNLKKFNIPVDNKIILYGHTGCGKTATANAIGQALNKKVITLNLGGFVSSRLGETGKNISEIFRNISYENAILFIDEFDFIGKMRDYDNKDSGEMKRLVNTLIQQIDNLADTSMLICATNHIDIIDAALLRRFQIKLKYKLPTERKLNIYYDSILAQFPKNITNIKRRYKISYAEVKDIVYQQVKVNIIQLEKQKKHLLFSYGTLKLEGVQLHNYGRKLKGKEDSLLGYKLENLEIKDASVIENSKINIHPIAIKTANKNDKIKGVVFEITGEELRQTDKYEVSDYKRVLETTELGSKVSVYISKK